MVDPNSFETVFGEASSTTSSYDPADGLAARPIRPITDTMHPTNLTEMTHLHPTTTLAALTAAFSLVALPAAATAAETIEISPENSKITFVIKNKPPGASDFQDVPGTFKEFGGKIVIDEADPAKSTVEIEVKTASVDTANEKRDDHLRNQDFFKV